MQVKYLYLVAVLVLSIGYPAQIFAYLGPGAGISAIGSVLAIIAAIVVALFGFLWYPIKRIMRKKKSQTEKNETKKDGQQAQKNK